MPIASGTRLGPYEILAPLGAGGMGEVYRARDPRLGREVAIKVLPSDRLADEKRRLRFVQEARAASQLNHPNIVTIHEIERDGEHDFIVMELVQGKSLDQLVPRGGMPVRDALRLAIPIADAVARAHAAGIVHRDLKPANVMVTDGGAPKVLDFGLAKLLAREDIADQATATEETAAPALSQTGVVSGTPAYMSPEQAEGREIDARSDIFSFGSLLYQMVTGRRAFLGASRQQTLDAVVSSEPQVPSSLASGVPVDLEKLILRCLRKDPDRRFQHMADVRVALEDVREESASGSSGRRAPAAGGTIWWRPPVVLGLSLMVAAIAVAMLSRLRPSAAVTRPGPLTQVTWDAGLSTDAAVSSAGNLLAYTSDRGGNGQLDLWVRPLPQGEPIRLTRSAEDDYEPSFSRDASRIAFRSDRDGGGIYLVSALGGPETRLADKGRHPRFSPDGQSIAYSVGETILSGGSVFVMPATGGPPRQIGEDSLRARNPLWSPDGKYLLCLAFPPGAQRPEWVALPVAVGDRVNTDAGQAFADLQLRIQGRDASPDAWSPDGEHVLFSALSGSSTNIWAIGLSPKTWQVHSIPRQLTFGTGALTGPAVADNRLYFTSATANVDLWSLPVDASERGGSRLQQLTSSPGSDNWPSISSDGRRVAYLSERTGAPVVWVKELETQREFQVTLPSVNAVYPRISADGSQVAYLVRGAASAVREAAPSAASPAQPTLELPRFQKGALFVVTVGPAGEVGVPRKVCDDCGRIWDWTPDGRWVVQRATGAVVLRDVSSGASHELLRDASVMSSDPRFSPDGKWIAFQSLTGPLTRRIFVAPFRAESSIQGSDWIPVSDGRSHDGQAAWAPDGSQLYYHSARDGFRCLWTQRLDPRSKRPVGEPLPVRHFHSVRGSMTTAIGDPGQISPSVGRGRIVFSLGEMTGNIWSTTY